MFPGDLAAGVPMAIWAMLIGSCIGGVCIAWLTSIPPLATGIDSPTGAFLVLLSASAASVITAAGGSADTAITTVMLIFTAATFVTGLLCYVVGALHWGAYFRFIPYFVVAGFLMATGGFLLAGGVRMASGLPHAFDILRAPWTQQTAAKLVAAVIVVLALLGVRRITRSPLAMPCALFAMWLAMVGVLYAFGFALGSSGWYLPSLGTLTPWLPWNALDATHLTMPMVLDLVPQFVAVAIVALMSLVTKVASLELSRQTSGDLDREFRAHGLGNLVIVPLGGIACSLQIGTSQLLGKAGGPPRLGGVLASLLLGAVALVHLDLPALIPIPIVVGLVLYLGYTFFVDALRALVAQRVWLDCVLAAAIAIVCIRYGYLVGVVAGIVAACVLFALSYARIGVVRRQATRAQFAGNVDRSAQAAQYLRRNGNAIQLYWLSGYIFFGSSEGLFERVRRTVEALPHGRVSYVILDFAMVTGADSSAAASLTKLTHFCNGRGATLVYSGLTRANQRMLEQGRLIGQASRNKAFIDVNHALAWCEDCLLGEARLHSGMDVEAFRAWLEDALGSGMRAADAMTYLERRDTHDAEVIYRAGEPADTIDLVAVGNLAVDLVGGDGERLRVRRFMNHTMVGEMGFVRSAARSATVLSMGPATIFTLTRAAFGRMRREQPDLAAAFDDFIMRTLADRVDTANRTAAALQK
jgi:SulP family sulfate permease